MDIWTTLTGFGVMGVIVGLFLIATWKGYTFQGLSKGMKNLALIGGVVFLVAGMAGAGWLTFSTATTPEETTPAASWDITNISESETELVRISGTDDFRQKITVNTTSDAFASDTQWFEFNVSLQGSGMSTVECTDVGTFTPITGTNAGDTIDLIATDANGDYDITYTIGSGDYTTAATVDGISANFPVLESHTFGYVNVNVTLNSVIPTHMETVDDSGTISFNICGNPVDIVVRVDTVNT